MIVLMLAVSIEFRVQNPTSNGWKYQKLEGFFTCNSTHTFWECFYKTISMLPDYFIVEVLICALFINRQLDSISCIDPQGKFTKSKVPLLKSAPYDHTVEARESTKDDYREQETEKEVKSKEFSYIIMSRKVGLNKHVALSPDTHVQVSMVTKIFELIHPEPEHVPWTGYCLCTAIWIHWVEANKPVEISLTNFSALERKLPKKMVIRFRARGPVIHLAIAGSIAVKICEAWHLMVGSTVAKTIQQPWTKVADLSFAPPDDKISRSMSTTQ